MLDTSQPPLLESARRQIVEHFRTQGDVAEAAYLEAKSQFDLTSNVDIAKVAKFLLGAANRDPEVAQHKFQGYAVMVLGVAHGTLHGVKPGVEQLQIQQKIAPYLGPEFPRFEVNRVQVEGKEVLFIYGLPPKDGQPPFPCRKAWSSNDRDNRKHNLIDGGIYFRDEGETRVAKASEIDMLVRRAKTSTRPPLRLELQEIGPIPQVVGEHQLMHELFDARSEAYEKWMDEKFPEEPSSLESMLSVGLLTNAFTDEISSRQTAERHLEQWVQKMPERMGKAAKRFCEWYLPGFSITVVSPKRQIRKPVLKFRIHDSFWINKNNDGMLNWNSVVPRIEPKPRGLLGGLDISSLMVDQQYQPHDHGQEVHWNHDGQDVLYFLRPEDFRPDEIFSTLDTEIIVLPRDRQATTVRVTWRLTEDGSDEVWTGEEQVPVQPVDVMQVQNEMVSKIRSQDSEH